LVTSANLTPSGMDLNFEFGVEFHDSAFISLHSVGWEG